jgi:2-oxopent-4-enoate/cis-2-oxohex-4-enoate hydratase
LNPWDRHGAAGRAVADSKVAMTSREHRRLADILMKATREQRPIAPLSTKYPELTVADALKIRDLAVQTRLAAGDRLVGAKISLESSALGMRAAAAGSRLGWVTEGMLLPGPDVDLETLIHPRVQAKIALRLARPLRRSLTAVSDLLELVDRVLPCLEIVDARYEPKSSESVDEIADNCSAARFALGAGRPVPGEADLRSFCVHLDMESGLDSTGTGPSPPRCSVETALWLANRVIDEGGELDAGGLLISAPCAASLVLRAGDAVRADFGSLGNVGIRTLDNAAEPCGSRRHACDERHAFVDALR